MRLTLLVNQDLASNLALSYLLPKLDDHAITIFYTNKSSQPKNQPFELNNLTQFEHSLLQQSELNLLTNDRSKAKEINRINDGVGFDQYQHSQPDLVISIRHMSILKSATIKLAKFGVINLHSGLLPQYRGVMATFWAMLNQETEIGTTLHFIDDAAIDMGRIITQSTTAVRYEQSYLWNVLNLYKKGCADIIKTIHTIAKQESIPATMQQDNANYYTFPTQQIFNRVDFALFNPTDTVAEFVE